MDGESSRRGSTDQALEYLPCSPPFTGRTNRSSDEGSVNPHSCSEKEERIIIINATYAVFTVMMSEMVKYVTDILG